MAVYSTAGSKVEIGAIVAQKAGDYVAADFTTALSSPATVGEPETIGTVSVPWETEEFKSVTDGRTRTFKTVRKGSTFELTCGLDPTDAGQLALRAAYETHSQYAVRVTLADKPSSGASPKSSTRTFAAMIMECADDLSAGIGKVKFTIQVNSNVVITHASAT